MTTGSKKIPATVITGFLGAGKTTLIRKLLENANGKRIALIINEFGDVGVDSEILKGCGQQVCGEEDIVELANGCICCTVADDFIPTMSKLINRDDPPDHIVIETSGLALPQPLIKAFSWPEIRSRVTVDGVVTVVDSAAVAEGRFAHDEHAVQAQRDADDALDHDSPLEELFEDQITCADMIVMNKVDLLSGTALDDVEKELRNEARNGVSFLRVSHGDVPINVLLGLSASAEDDMDSRKSHHEQHGEEDHDHDDFESFVVAPKMVEDRNKFLDKLTALICKFDILRLKGFVDIQGADARLVVQAVGPRIESYFDRPWGPGERRYSSLVVIGEKGLDQPAISSALEG
ncbi:MAG: cobalamin biosynthesis protein CobW [Rhizobiales bacterium]|nr:cobalamin biosynthesis protein CobW [Hyphomicrobiales bacterium]